MNWPWSFTINRLRNFSSIMFHVFFFCGFFFLSSKLFSPTLSCFLSVSFPRAGHSAAGMDPSPPRHLYPSLIPFSFPFPSSTHPSPHKRWVVFPETQVQSYQRGAGPRPQRHDFNVIRALCLPFVCFLPAHPPVPVYSPPSSPNHSISLTDCVPLIHRPTFFFFFKLPAISVTQQDQWLLLLFLLLLKASSRQIICSTFTPLHTLWQRLCTCSSQAVSFLFFYVLNSSVICEELLRLTVKPDFVKAVYSSVLFLITCVWIVLVCDANGAHTNVFYSLLILWDG